MIEQTSAAGDEVEVVPGPMAPGQAEAVARVYGEPLLELPRDLYIPPQALQVFLEAFEGPLDLLLYLIRKQNLDVLDIPMAALTRQYLEYVEAMRQSQLELAAEYLLMAAMLIDIKSRLLLPRPPSAVAEEEDPRAELVRRLLEYERFKQAARALDALPLLERDFERVEVWLERSVAARLPQVRPEDLRTAWTWLLQRARANRHHLITREELSVRAQMSRILRELSPGRFVDFVHLFDERGSVPHVVVTFLAVLELARERLLELAQAEPYAPIYVRRVAGGEEAPAAA